MHNMMNLKSSASPAGLYGILSMLCICRCVSTAEKSTCVGQGEFYQGER